MIKDKNTETFLALLRAGLWEVDNINLNHNLDHDKEVDWEKVYQLAEEQSVLGLVLAGIERLKNANVNLDLNQELLLQWIGEVQILEQQNLEMNRFIEWIIKGLRGADIYTLLVKGQGIAQCYERPLWRTCGDVDLYLSETNYKRAQEFLTPKAQSVDVELHGEQHIAMHIDQWVVELHGAMPTRLISRIDKVLEKIQNNLFRDGEIRYWQNGHTIVFLPSPNNDVLIVFTHILKHFYRGGIGLRQICDWCRLLWTYKDSLNYGLLEKRIRQMGLMTEWKAFAALAVRWLGMPEDAMPLYFADNKKAVKRWERKADLIVDFVLETGNFGHNRELEYYTNHSFFLVKAISLWRQTVDCAQHFRIFPIDSIKIWCRIIKGGLIAVIRR